LAAAAFNFLEVVSRNAQSSSDSYFERLYTNHPTLRPLFQGNYDGSDHLHQPAQSRLRQLKEDADKAAAATAAMATQSQVDVQHHQKPQAQAQGCSPKHTAHRSYFPTPDQLSTIIRQHRADSHLQSWAGGDFYVGAAGEDILAGSLELTTKLLWPVDSGRPFQRVSKEQAKARV
jgi:hypothetical protein